MKVALVLLAACAGATAEAPLTVQLNVSRVDAEKALHAHQYCRKDENPPQPQEVYPRCDRPGTEWGDSWVQARYEGDRLVELRRWERYADDAHAVERWNQLVAERAKLTPESAEAAQAIRDKGLLEPGTRSMKAFRVDASTVVGIYLLQPQEPERAAVLEKISLIDRAN